jgi:hypothetical protein
MGENIWKKHGSEVKHQSIQTFMRRFSENPGHLNLLEPSGPIQASNRTALPLTVSVWSIQDGTQGKPILTLCTA